MIFCYEYCAIERQCFTNQGLIQNIPCELERKESIRLSKFLLGCKSQQVVSADSYSSERLIRLRRYYKHQGL